MSLLSRCAFFVASIVVPCHAQQQLMTPDEFLGYPVGERFTSHYRAIEYFRHVASALPNVDIVTYGETYEHRPLVYLTVTSPDNFRRLEQIRTDNLKRAGLESGSPTGEKIAIVWLSYNVHGNEASSMEAAMLTLYDLADPANKKTQEWLRNTVVILDPCINPDGRDRYVNFYRQYGNSQPNPDYGALEHRERWPGGRTNHYLFDLNRDWAWCSQIESKQRIEVYNQWLPHVHVDFHEQGYDNPYFFAPAAEPLHEVISPWQREFQLQIGKNNAKYFDERGWLYFTKEVFDLYYPSYGDTYPTYNGAIGMTYEQAGGGAGGLAVTTETGQILTLKDRIEHHHTSGLATVEITSRNAARVTEEFQKYYRENNTSPAAEYKTYVIKASNDADKLRQLTTWMSSHAIRFGHPASNKTTRGYNFQTQAITPVSISTDDLIFNVYQPKSRFITTIFEPTSRLSDSLTYDITAWNPMYAYNLNGWAVTEKIDIGKTFTLPSATEAAVANPYAYIFKYTNLRDVSFLAALLEYGMKVRCAEKGFSLNGETFSPGTLIITRSNNEDVPEFDQTIREMAGRFGRTVHTANTGFVEEGKDLGSADLRFLSPPNIAMLMGEQTSALSCGEVWHLFEQQIEFPVTQIGTDYFRPSLLKSYDVLIVPEGSYQLFQDNVLEELLAWVGSGGRLILIGSALNAVVDKKGFALKTYATDAEKLAAEQKQKDQIQFEGFPRYEEYQRKQLSATISGAVYKVPLDNSHPLAFGLKPFYYTLKTHGRRFAWLQNGWNVGYFKGPVQPVQGFAGYKANRALHDSLIIGAEQIGKGHIIYFVDNPLFRSFWEDGKMLFANAVFLVGN